LATVLSYNLNKIARMIPGYDPFATAKNCEFREDVAQLAIEFFPECLSHIEGIKAGHPFELEDWEKAIVANLFGWFRPDGTRRYRECLIFVPRKNGKTPLASGIGIYHIFCDPERGQQNYIAASTREQAGLLFRHCRGMVEQEDELDSRCRIYGGNAPGGQSQSIVREDVGSFLKVIAGDTKVGKHGRNANLVIVDELHEQQTADLVETLRTSMASANKPQPLLIYTTTSDYERPSICNEIHLHACKVRDGLIEDFAFLPVIYEATKDEDWTDSKVWEKANPNLGVSVSEEYLKRECERAKESPAYENTFKRLHLNIRTEQAERLLPIEKWDACMVDELPDLTGKRCWCGLDIGSTGDFTAFVAVFHVENRFAMVPIFWIPQAAATKRRGNMGAVYKGWEDAGLLRITPGNEVEYARVENDIVEFASKHGMVELAIDRLFQGASICQTLGEKHGLPVFAHGQGFTSMALPTRQFLEMVGNGTVMHDGNAVLRWMVSNLAGKSDEAGNCKPDKKRSAEKIDGVVAAIMGLGRAIVGASTEPKISFYETHGLEHA
jgi:phage terminase large subunit-like protein